MASERVTVTHRQFQTLFQEGTAGVLTDRELLERFEARDNSDAELAFALLVERHGGMVLQVCRRLLGNEHDAQDASQATFLVLAKRTGSIHNRDSVGAWLHRVAVRMACKLRASAARRRTQETRGREMAIPRSASPHPTEAWTELHEELERLPERFRIPLVLCYLEGLTHQQAAQRLKWPLGTVESRLTRGRQRLRERLLRRGVVASTGLAALTALPESTSAAVPPGWLEATAHAATRFAAGEPAVTVSSTQVASLVQGTLKTMTPVYLKLSVIFCLAAGLTATARCAMLWSAPDDAVPLQQNPTASKAPENRAEDTPIFSTLNVRGRVLQPNGKPLVDAKLSLAFQTIDWTWATRIPRLRTASTDGGHFGFILTDNDDEVKLALRTTSGWPGGFGGIQVVATADGFAPTWGSLDKTGDLKLKPADTPIEGRLINLEGSPLPGVEIRVLLLEDPAIPNSLYVAASGIFPQVTTDRDGRFRLPSIGAGRRAALVANGHDITREYIYVVSEGFPSSPQDPRSRGALSVYGPKFEHPCKPGRSISGVVRDKATGSPLAGITVRSFIGSEMRTVTNAEGRYRLEGLSKQPSYHLIASAPESNIPYMTSERAVDDVTGLASITADLEMVRGVFAHGRLIDRATKRPVQAWVGYAAMHDNPNWSKSPGFDMAINKYSPSPGRHVPSMADGSFRLVVLPGQGFLVAHIQYQADIFLRAGVPPKGRPGAQPDALEMRYDTVPFELFPQNFPAVRPINVPAGADSIECNLTFDSGVIRQGTVLDSDGQPLAGASLIGETHANTHGFLALADSHFTVYGLSSDPLLSRRLILRHEKRGLGAAVRVGADDGSPLQIRLEPLATLTGRLVDEKGNPRTQAHPQLLAVLDDPLRASHLEFSPPIKPNLDDDGRFRFEGVVPGVKYNVQVGDSFPLWDWKPKAGETKDLGNIPPKTGR